MIPFIRALIRSGLLILVVLSMAGAGWALSASEAGGATVGPVIVIGFVGGFVKHDDMVHSAVQVAARIRRDYPDGVETEVFENHRSEEAHKKIIRFLDSNHDGILSPEEKKNAKIILYGHSWGASEAIMLARQLGREGIAVLLTVQVDSVEKTGENDRVIPPNVLEAANFYQPHGFLHGEPQIRAADPARTQIVGNFRFDYKTNPVGCKHYPWYDRIFMRSHIEIECDPKVWKQVETLIESRLPTRN